MYKRLVVGTVINIINLGFNIVVNFALLPVFIHSLGDEVYGLWVFVASFSVVRGFLQVFDLGIQSAVVKYVAEHNSNRNTSGIGEVFSVAFIVYSVIGIVVASGLLLVMLTRGIEVFGIPPTQIATARSLFLIFALQTLIDFVGLSVTGLIEGLQRFDITRGYNIVRLIVFSICSLLFLSFGAGVYALAFATLLSEGVRLAACSYWAKRLVPTLRVSFGFSRQTIGSMTSLSGKVFLFVLVNTVYEQMDRLIIAVLLTTTLLTDYDISFRIHTLVFAMTTIISPFMVSAASHLNAQGDREGLRHLLKRVTLYTGVFTVPVALLVIALVEPLTMLWIGPDYLHTTTTTRLFVSYLLFTFLLRAGQNMLIGINRLEMVLPVFALGVVVNLLISVVAASRFGVMGVVLGTVAGNLVVGLPYLRVFKHQFGLTYRDIVGGVLLRIYPGAIIGALLASFLYRLFGAANMIQIGIWGLAGLIAFVLIFFTTGMPTEERMIVMKWLRLKFRQT